QPMSFRFRMLVSALLVSACGSETTDPVPTVGSLRISATTHGVELDRDGYALQLDDAPAVVLPSSGLLLSGLTPGSHRVALRGVAPNCLADQNPRTVTVDASQQHLVVFVVTCRSTKGSLALFVSTEGFGADPNGYVVSLDGGLDRTLRLEDSLTVGGLDPGPHQVAFGGASPVCESTPASPIPFTAVADYRVEIRIL